MKNKLLIIFLAVFLMSATSCNDWLDVKPRTEQAADEMFETLQGYKDALMGCYMNLKSRNLYGENLTMTTIEYLAQHWELGLAYTGNTAEAAKRWDYDDLSLKNRVQGFYSGLYNVIVQANDILLAIPETGESAIRHADVRAIVEAEALALRAFCHFDVLRLFGQMPSGGSKKVKLPYSEDVSYNPVAYYDFDEFVSKIEKDLSDAEKLLLDSDPFVPHEIKAVNAFYGNTLGVDEFLLYRGLRLNYWAVKALKARLYLYSGQNDKAYSTAMEVINAQNEDGSQKFTLTKINEQTRYFALPEETLFALNCPSMYEYTDVLFRRDLSNQKYLHMTPEKLEEMFGEPVGVSTNNRHKNLWDYDVYFDYITPVLKKYDQENRSTLSFREQMLYKEIVPIIRLSEVYLIAMETSKDMAEINALYDTYRIARDIVGTTFTSKNEVMDMIVKEYRIEFFGEGQMFFTYKRMGTEHMLWTEKSDVEGPGGGLPALATEAAYIIPLPLTEYDPNL